jgi:nanoRNase/pAp phosphatase (c-di-AMP/oligoRNAs hydrolase)
MRYVLISPDDFLWRLLGPTALGGERPLHLVATASLSRRINQGGGQAQAGDLEADATYRRALRTGREAVVIAAPPEDRGRLVAAIRRVAPAAPVVIVADDPEAAAGLVGATVIAPADFAAGVVEPAVERAGTRAWVEGLRRHFASAGRVLIMMQDDPDPDAIASALALRALLARTKTTAPIATFGSVGRAENRAMIRILEIDVEEIKARALDEYDMVAMVDAQPSFFEETFGDIDLVIDHHPEDTPVQATIKDVRPAYGATSTILTEYLRSADVKLSPRLATALLYGIKADTLHLERGATRADMEAFAFLHGYANHSALRRIERPAMPGEALDILAAGIRRRVVRHGVLFTHLGPVPYPELVAQFADLFLQVEEVEWSVVSGTVNGELHISVRNVGYVRAAGDVVRQAFGTLGSAGGHRSMAKAVIRLRDWRRQVGDTGDDALPAAITARFLRALQG